MWRAANRRATRSPHKMPKECEDMKVVAFGHALPKRSVTNEELTRFVDTTDEWIRDHTGIESRRIITGKSADKTFDFHAVKRSGHKD